MPLIQQIGADVSAAGCRGYERADAIRGSGHLTPPAWLTTMPPPVAGEMGNSLGSTEPQSRRLPKEPDAASDLGALVLRVSWLAILLGLGIQILLLIVAIAFGHLPALNPVVAHLVQTISWSIIVCVGIAIGAAVSGLRLETTGLAGLLSAPIAFTLARSLHKGVSAAMGLPIEASGSQSPLVLGVITAVEYGTLGVIISWSTRRGRGSAAAHALVGLCVGVFFGAIALSYLHLTSVKGMGAADLLSRGINEVLYPIGCSLVLFASGTMGKHWQSASAND